MHRDQVTDLVSPLLSTGRTPTHRDWHAVLDEYPDLVAAIDGAIGLPDPTDRPITGLGTGSDDVTREIAQVTQWTPDIQQRIGDATGLEDLTIDVWIVCGLGHSNGFQGRFDSGSPFVGICPDMPYTDAGLRILLAHEFAHVAHTIAAGTDRYSSPDPEADAVLGIWVEGLATYISGLVCPDQSPDELLWFADTTQMGFSRACADHATAIVEALDNESAYQQMFLGGEVAGLTRTGYWLGLQVVRHILEDTPELSPAEAVRLDPETVRRLVEGLLSRKFLNS